MSPGLLVGALAVLVAALALLIGWRARRRPSTDRPFEPMSRRPDGAVLAVTGFVRRPLRTVVAQLADWHVRGVVHVQPRGPVLPESRADQRSSGPEWEFTLGATDGLGPVERTALTAFFPPGATPGTTWRLTREDQDHRDVIARCFRDARRRHLITVGRPHGGERALVIITAVVAAFAAAVVWWGAVELLGLALVWVSILAAVALVAVVLLAALPSRGTAAQRAFQEQVDMLRAWVEARPPTPELAGWATLWELPGPWRDAVPPELRTLSDNEESFRRALVDLKIVPV